ncbi:hypothetical protein FHG87_024528 [Trinorchestia longiramus]|nr:hypothetical protein FHG87_024528 [Trinorchestia longiramus]
MPVPESQSSTGPSQPFCGPSRNLPVASHTLPGPSRPLPKQAIDLKPHEALFKPPSQGMKRKKMDISFSDVMSTAVETLKNLDKQILPDNFATIGKFFICEIHWGVDPPLIKLHGGSMRLEIPPSIFNAPASCLPSPKPSPRPAKVEDQQLSSHISLCRHREGEEVGNFDTSVGTFITEAVFHE